MLNRMWRSTWERVVLVIPRLRYVIPCYHVLYDFYFNCAMNCNCLACLLIGQNISGELSMREMVVPDNVSGDSEEELVGGCAGIEVDKVCYNSITTGN